jgi:hypothetical protein
MQFIDSSSDASGEFVKFTVLETRVEAACTLRLDIFGAPPARQVRMRCGIRVWRPACPGPCRCAGKSGRGCDRSLAPPRQDADKSHIVLGADRWYSWQHA